MRFQTSLVCDADASAAGRRALDECLEGSSDATVVDAIRLATSELISNAVRHGRLAAGDEIRLTVDLQEDVVRVVVEQPTAADDAVLVQTVDRTGEGGFGLAIVEALTDRWGVSGDAPAYVWFEIRLP
jgi:anti-sigma regulatory factor (Ser/Thr protein kinase)